MKVLRINKDFGDELAIVKKEDKYYVQETIGGWRQNAIFSGTLDECKEYMKDCYGNFAIVKEDDYEVDYLN